jgi:hypothetical protein
VNSLDSLSLLEAQERRLGRLKALVGEEAFERIKASGRSSGIFAMASEGYEGLRRLANDFENAYLARWKLSDPFAWEFLDGYNPAELRWLYESEYFSHSDSPNRSARLRLLANLLHQRGIHGIAKN